MGRSNMRLKLPILNSMQHRFFCLIHNMNIFLSIIDSLQESKDAWFIEDKFLIVDCIEDASADAKADSRRLISAKKNSLVVTEQIDILTVHTSLLGRPFFIIATTILRAIIHVLSCSTFNHVEVWSMLAVFKEFGRRS